MPVRFPREGNPLYPLPPDYETLEAEGKRLARINAVSLQDTPEDFVHAWAFFRGYYLEQLPDGHFYEQKVASPPMHYEVVRDMAAYPRNAIAAPRGFAKSTVFGTEIPLLMMLTRPYFSTLLLLAKDSMVERRFDRIMQQLDANEYIIEDFGRQRPVKGEGIWNRHMLRLANGAALIGSSVEGKLRGERPRLIVCDDPEFDPEGENRKEAMDRLLRQFERWLFRIIIPMLKRGSSLLWIGTRVSERSFLTHVTSSADPRFRFWNRRVYDAEAGDGTSLWDEMWSWEALQQRREEIGIAAYNAEYRNKPGTGEDCALVIHPDYNTYQVEGGISVESPLSSDAYLVIREPTDVGPVERKLPWADTVGRMFRFITVDPTRTAKSSSDFCAVHVMALDHKNCLWSLDLLLARMKRERLIREAWKMAIRWKVKVLGVESVADQEEILDRMSADLGDIATTFGWTPRLLPITYPPGVSKGERIIGLAWRFDQHKIKLPAHRAHDWPYKELWHQIHYATEDLELLRYDDAVDTLAMSQQVVRSRKPQSPHASEVRTAAQSLMEGRKIHEVTGLPLIEALCIQTMDPAVFMEMVAKTLPTAPRPRAGRRVTGGF